MDKIAPIIAGALLVAGCAARTIPLQIQEAWFECEADRECMVLEDPRCTLVPINRRYAGTFTDWVRLYRASQVTSGPCNYGAFRYEPVCEASRCSSSLVRSP